MTQVLLIAVSMVLRVQAVPPAAGQATVEAQCADGSVSSSVMPFPGEVRLDFSCQPVVLRAAAPGYLAQMIAVSPDRHRLDVTLPRLARLSYGAGGTEAIAGGWRSGQGKELDRIAFGPSALSALVAPGDGCLALVRAGRAPQVDPLRLGPGQLVALPKLPWRPGVSLDGAVADPDQVPVAAAIAAVAASERDQAGGPSGDPCEGLLAQLGVTTQQADKNGGFSLGPLAPGRWRIVAKADGYAPLEWTLVLGPTPSVVHLEHMVLQPVATLVLSVDLSRADSKLPVEIALEREHQNVLRRSERWQTERTLKMIDNPGVVVENLTPGLYRVVLRKPGSDLVFAGTVDLVRGARQELILKPAPILVAGQVRQGKDDVTGATVTLSHDGLQRSATSDEHGSYALRVWTAADYAATVAREGDTSPFPTHVDLTGAKPGDSVVQDFDLPEKGVRGRVVERTSGDPISGARVTLVERRVDNDFMSQLGMTTDREGSFSFPFVTEGATDSLSARAEGYLPVEQPLDTSGSATPQVVVLALERGDEIHGHVVGPAGEPVLGATVGCCAVGIDGRFGTATQTAADGSFVLTASPQTVIWAVAANYSIGWGVATDNRATIVLQARSPMPSMRLRDRANAPVPSARVAFTTDSGLLVPPTLVEANGFLNGGSTISGADGVVSPTGLPPGFYSAWLISTTGLTALGVVQVPSSVGLTFTVGGTSGTK